MEIMLHTLHIYQNSEIQLKKTLSNQIPHVRHALWVLESIGQFVGEEITM